MVSFGQKAPNFINIIIVRVFKKLTFHGDSEVNDGAPGADLRGVRGVGQLGRDEEGEAVENVHLFVAKHHLENDLKDEVV